MKQRDKKRFEGTLVTREDVLRELGDQGSWDRDAAELRRKQDELYVDGPSAQSTVGEQTPVQKARRPPPVKGRTTTEVLTATSAFMAIETQPTVSRSAHASKSKTDGSKAGGHRE